MVKLNLKELLGILWCSLFFGFIFAFRDFGDPPSLEYGFQNILLSSVINFFVLCFFVLLVKLISEKKGYFCTFRPSIIADIVFLYITFMSYGFIQVVTSGLFEFKADELKRIGNLKIETNFEDLYKISILFILYSAIILFAYKFLLIIFSNVPFLNNIYLLKALVLLPIGFFIPIPKTLGYYVLFEKKTQFFLIIIPYVLFMLAIGFIF